MRIICYSSTTTTDLPLINLPTTGLDLTTRPTGDQVFNYTPENIVMEWCRPPGAGHEPYIFTQEIYIFGIHSFLTLLIIATFIYILGISILKIM